MITTARTLAVSGYCGFHFCRNGRKWGSVVHLHVQSLIVIVNSNWRKNPPVLSKGLIFHWPSFGVHFLVLLVLHCRKEKSQHQTLHYTQKSVCDFVCVFSCAQCVLLPAYLPPLLRLIRQRMNSISSISTMALMSPINQPWVANPPGISEGTARQREAVSDTRK